MSKKKSDPYVNAPCLRKMEMDKRLVLECISKLGVYIIEAIYFTSVCRNR